MRPLGIRARSVISYVSLLTALVVATTYLSARIAPSEQRFVRRVLLLALGLPCAWALSHASFLRCGFCGTRYAQHVLDYLQPRQTCRACGVSPGARETTASTINSLLLHRYGRWGLPDDGIAPDLRNVSILDGSRRAPYLQRLRGDIECSHLSLYDRKRLARCIDVQLSEPGGTRNPAPGAVRPGAV